MLFNSLKFLIFFPVVFLLHWGLPHGARKYLLLAASYYFYMCWKPEFIVLILCSTAVNYFCARGMERTAGKQKKRLLAAALLVSFGLLFFFKYFNFFGETLTAICRAVSIPFSAPMLDIILPVGISFYTFQTISYTIDVYRGKMQPERDFVTFALFVSYFPQLVAGPIEKAENLLPQLKSERAFSYEKAACGLRLMMWGFFKKCVASAYFAKLADSVYDNLAGASGGAVALATAAFALQIYCDFGGYSDIARGCSRMMGVELMENFRRPYLAKSMREFWQRWHISLTGWFREYVYIPLGGNRKGLAKTCLFTLATFFLSGLWHGADWTFVVWGGLNGLYLIAELLWRRVSGTADSSRMYGNCYKVFAMLKTFVFACLAWIFFRADSMAEAMTALRAVFFDLRAPAAWLSGALGAFLSPGKWTALMVPFSAAALFLYDLIDERRDVTITVGRLKWYVRWPLYLVFLFGLVLLIPKETPAPFIYFQF